VLRVLLISGQVVRAFAARRGQTLVEYTLILALVAVAAVLLLVAVGWDLQETFDEIEDLLGVGSNGVAPGDDDATPS
jgi:Flp pilus assembly pilin Flp